jgi:PAS domain S-box-containing protein
MMRRLSSRFHLALGMSSMVVTLALLAVFVGLVPDRDGALRQGRAALAEAVALSANALLDPVANDEDDTRLDQVLGLIAQRNPDLRQLVLRAADGSVRWQAGAAAGAVTDAAASAEPGTGLLHVPLLRDGQVWGQAELQFVPLPSELDGWRGVLNGPAAWVAALGLSSFVLFYLYLRRMLRHLDPSSAIPGRVRTAFDTLAEGLLVLNPQGRIVLANRAFVEVVGGEAEALTGRKVQTLNWVDVPAGGSPWDALVSDGQLHRNVLMHLVGADGRRRSFMVNGSPVPGAGGKPAGVLASLDDVTALEEQEIQLRLARDVADQANRSKSEFLAHMSHEIRTPMNAIIGFAELLRRGWQHDPRDTQRHLDTILGSGRHLLALINDILDLSKVEAGHLELERQPCAVHQVVQEVVTILNVKAVEKGLALRVNFPQALPATVLTDAARVRQVVTNLVGNAIKFTARGEVSVTLRLALDAEPLRLAIDVRDSGIGIAHDKLDAIFDPFVQAEASTTRQYGGTGLGLAISRRLARALGGDLVASSTLGAGSTFHVTLDPGPLDDVAWLAPEWLNAHAGQRAAAVAPTRWAFDGGCVLVVDDGEENRELVRVVLEASGLTVIEAENGEVALRRVAADAPDLVLMDVQMPVMDGYTATRLLRERGCTLPVLALTANAMKGFEREIEAAGFTGHLTKPVDIDAMLAALALRLGGRPVDEAAAVSILTSSAREPAPSSAPPAALPPIVSRLATHPRLAKVVRTFGRTLPLKLAAMQAALDAGRLAELAELAHWLKGAGGTVGFDDFFEPAREFELNVKDGDVAVLAAGLRTLQGLAARMVVPEEDPSATAAAATTTTTSAAPTPGVFGASTTV